MARRQAKAPKIETYGYGYDRMVICGDEIQIYDTCTPYNYEIEEYIEILNRHVTSMGIHDATVDMQDMQDDPYDTGAHVVVRGWRKMTDDERVRADRWRADAIIKAKQTEEYQRRQYEQLKKKFEHD